MKILLILFFKNFKIGCELDFDIKDSNVSKYLCIALATLCKRLAMSGDSANSETVRLYFIKLREFLTENQHLIFQAIENKQDLNKYVGFESIYFFAVDNRKMNWKIERTKDIVNRLQNYNVGRIKEVDLKYFAIVKNQLLIQKCIKLKLKNNQVIPNREIYNVTPLAIKKVITDCYCKYVPASQNKDLYEEISNLLGIYAYVKDKTNIKPYIIIGQDI